MYFETLDFVAHVPLGGYEVVTAGKRRAQSWQAYRWDPTSLILVERPAPPARTGYMAVRPDDENPALFLEFAHLDPADPGQYAAFAGRYGFLGEGIGSYMDGRDWGLDGKPEETPATAENVYYWRRSSRTMRLAFVLNGLVERGDTAELARYVRRCRDGTSDGLWWHVRGEWNAEEATGGEEADYGWEEMTEDEEEPDDIREVTRRWVDGVVDAGIGEAATVRFRRDERTGRRGARVQVTHLLGLMWFQLARAIADDRNYRPCPACGAWFELLPKHRGRKEFCDLKCKLRDYRKRQRRAAELAVEGKSAKEIAAAVETDLATVKRWVRKGR